MEAVFFFSAVSEWKRIMSSEPETADEEAERTAEKFVAALTNVLQARKTGSASISLRGELAIAHANAAKVLNTKKYNDAVLKATRISDLA
jgi:hypothetical protein